MSNIHRDDVLNARLAHSKPGRTFLAKDTARWGELILPDPSERRVGAEQGLRLVVFTSAHFGFLCLDTIKAFQQSNPSKLSLVGHVTDDPANVDAKIAVKKRLWHFMDPKRRLDVETATIEAALSFGVPVYTGDVKCEWFREILREWAPDAILCMVFGQRLDLALLSAPPLGVYNMHPSDLAAGVGVGTSPQDAVIENGLESAAWTVHLMDEAFDHGKILGTSPPFNVRLPDGSYFEDPMQYFDKGLDGLDYMLVGVLEALVGAHRHGRRTPLDAVDIHDCVPAAVRQKMVQPIDPGLPRVPLRRTTLSSAAILDLASEPEAGAS